MSLIIQRSVFTANSHTLTLEANPNTIEALEKIAIALGASTSEENSHYFDFDFDSDERAEQCLLALEKIWNNIQPLDSPFKIKICCETTAQSLFIEGDDKKLQALVALIRCFGKEIVEDVVTFSKDEWEQFDALHSATIAMGILPYC